MPSTYAHYRMGQEIRKLITGNEKTIINSNADLFNIGLHGPDILFYYEPLHANKINQIGYEMHERPACEFFEKAAELVKKKECNQAYLAYVYGFICHFALDVTCHGYIDEKIRQSGISHAEIEVEFDRELMVMDRWNPISHQLTHHIVIKDDISEVIKDFYPGVTTQDISKALKGMKYYNKLLVAPSKVKRAFIQFLLYVSGNYEEMHGLMVNYEKNEECEDSTKKLVFLYEEAKKLSIRLIHEYQKYLLGEKLDDTFQYTFGSKLVREMEKGKEEVIYEI